MWPVPCFRCVHKSGPDRCSRPTRSYAASYALPIGGRRAERCAGCAPLCRSDRSTSFASDDAGLNNITCVEQHHLCGQMCADVCRGVPMRSDACVQRSMDACRKYAHGDSHACNESTRARTHTCLAQSSGTTALPSSLKRSPAQRSPPTDAPARKTRSAPAVRLPLCRGASRSCVLRGLAPAARVRRTLRRALGACALPR